MANNFQEYPKRMVHKDHAVAVFKPLTPEEQAQKGLFAAIPQLLSPARYPDVTVSNIDQEKQYASKGYRPANNANAEEYERTILDSKTVDGYKFNAGEAYHNLFKLMNLENFSKIMVKMTSQEADQAKQAPFPIIDKPQIRLTGVIPDGAMPAALGQGGVTVPQGTPLAANAPDLVAILGDPSTYHE